MKVLRDIITKLSLELTVVDLTYAIDLYYIAVILLAYVIVKLL